MIKAEFAEGSRTCVIEPEEVWQWDVGQKLIFEGLSLPEIYQVHFGLEYSSEDAEIAIGGATGVEVPDKLLENSGTLYAWVYLSEGAADGETAYVVVIPVTRRAKPGYLEPTEDEGTYIQQLVALLQEAEKSAGESAETATEARDEAVRVHEETEAIVAQIETLVAQAEASEEAASNAKDDAESARDDAEDAKQAAENARDAARESAGQAHTDAEYVRNVATSLLMIDGNGKFYVDQEGQ